MVMRLFLVGGAAFIVAAWLLTVPFSPAPYQGSAVTPVERYRAAGIVPMPGELEMSRSIGHEVFEVPAEDAEHAQMGSMGGMDMSVEGDRTAMPGMQMPGMTMPETGEDHAQMPGMAMPEHGEETQGQMPGMAMPEHGEGRAQMSGQMTEAHGGRPGMVSESAGGHGGGDLRVLDAHDPAVVNPRRLQIDMHEWGFTPGSLEVKAGEVIRLTVRNTGNIPHEFMFMSHAAMGAVRYRQQRADWNLLEHEAAYEKPIVMPGDEFQVILKIEQPGAWMFMCMFPYHMQFGMMGTMATEGMAMDMDMGGMNM